MKAQPLVGGFADLMTERRKIKFEFFEQINTLVDWRLISNILNKHYQKGRRIYVWSKKIGLLSIFSGLIFKKSD